MMKWMVDMLVFVRLVVTIICPFSKLNFIREPGKYENPQWRIDKGIFSVFVNILFLYEIQKGRLFWLTGDGPTGTVTRKDLRRKYWR